MDILDWSKNVSQSSQQYPRLPPHQYLDPFPPPPPQMLVGVDSPDALKSLLAHNTAGGPRHSHAHRSSSAHLATVQEL